MISFISGVVFSLSAAVSAQDTVAVVGATLIDGRGGAPVPNSTVIMAGGRFVAAGPSAGVAIPKRARRIEATGKYLIPGLMDANIHLVMPFGLEFVARYEDRFADIAEESAQLALKYGLTTVFDSWGPLEPLKKARDRINRGETPGARMFVAGNIIGFTGPFGRDFDEAGGRLATPALVRRITATWEQGVGAEMISLTADSLRQAMRTYIGKGVDFIKYGASGHVEMDMLTFSPEQQRVIVEEGHRAGLIVQTHTTSRESFRQAIEAGVDMMQHCTMAGYQPLGDDLLKMLTRRPVMCAIQPQTKKGLAFETARFSPVPRFRGAEFIASADTNNMSLVRLGIPVALATDQGRLDTDRLDAAPGVADSSPMFLPDGHFRWFEAMKEKGMEPMTALLSATRNVAQAYNKLTELGTVEPGKRADLLILDANPLDDIMNVRSIRAVIKDGVVVDRDVLPTTKVLTRARP